MKDYSELLARAKAATPGPWVVDPDDRPNMGWNNHIVDEHCGRICFMANDGTKENIFGQANAEHIAAANPTEIIGLIEDVQRLRLLLRRAANVMEGPSNAIYNDNNDLTVTGFNTYEAATGCYFVRRDIIAEIGEPS